MLDDLAHEDPAERTVRGAAEVLDEVGLLDVEALAACVRRHVRVRVDAARLDAGLAQQAEQLAAAAADVEDGRRSAEVIEVATLALADRVGAATHPALEGEVIRDRSRRGLSGNRDRRGRPCAAGGNWAPLQTLEPLLQLAHQSLRLLASDRRGVGALGEGVDELQHRVVEDPLIGRERLDVPAHELAQKPLDRALRPAAGRPLRRDRPEALGEGPCRGEFRPPRVPLDSTTSKLLAEPLEQGGDVDLLRRGNTCRRRVFRLRPGHSEDCTG